MASSISTGVLSSDTLIFTGRNRINAVTVLTDGTNAATVNLYDARAASGKIAVSIKCLGTALINHITFDNPIIMEDGIYADVTGTGATFIVFYAG